MATFVVFVQCRPEPPGYKYQPLSSYGSPAVDNIFGNTGIDTAENKADTLKLQPVIHKHVYVHIPPPDDDEKEYKPPKVPIAPPQKHYKIIFIKAPSEDAPDIRSLPVPPLNEEKTIVYVLVKKPDEDFEFTVPTASPTQPSKPEVFYIRYKTKQGDVTASYGPENGPDIDSRSTSGIIERKSENGIIPTEIHSGSISDAILGVTTVTETENNYSTTLTPAYETTGFTAPY